MLKNTIRKRVVSKYYIINHEKSQEEDSGDVQGDSGDVQGDALNALIENIISYGELS